MFEAELDIERMTYGGAGFGRLEGKACFVPFTAPGDRARVRVVKEKRSFAEGELLELPVASPMRVPPPCPIFGTCGGCDWQHLPYPEQVREKGEIFGETLSRIGRVDRDAVLPVAPAPDPYGYRTRIQLKLSLEGGRAELGFYRRGSHQVVDAAFGCAIAHPLLNRMASELRSLFPRVPELSGVSGIDLAMGDDGEGIALLQVQNADPSALARALGARSGELPSVAGLYLRLGAKSRVEKVFGVDSLSYGIPAGLFPGSRPMRLRFGRGGFSQVNYPQNLRLIRAVFELARPGKDERVLDLYCGNGNISVPVAPFVKRLHGVEGYAPSVDDALLNARMNGVDNATFEACDAAAAVRRLAGRGERFDLVILDPPRSGAQEIGAIARLAPRAIVYVSCDPPTLSRDLALLSEKGYRVTGSQPIDMFPQTYHLESVTLLERL